MTSHQTDLQFNCPKQGWLCAQVRPGGIAVALHAGLALLNSRLVMVGGRGEVGVSPAVYRREEEDWRLMDQLSPGRDQSASVVVPAVWAGSISTC